MIVGVGDADGGHGRSRSGTPVRKRILEAMRAALREAPWSEISVSEVAARSGVSRQTVYNTFSTRSGLALACMSETVVALIEQHVPDAASRARVDTHDGLLAGFRAFFSAVVTDPVLSQLAGVVGEASALGGLVEPQTMIAEASTRLAQAYASEWDAASDLEAGMLARAVVRLCLSYVAVPPGPDCDAAAEMAALLTPWVDTVPARHGSRPGC